jgi:hypothetical protein
MNAKLRATLIVGHCARLMRKSFCLTQTKTVGTLLRASLWVPLLFAGVLTAHAATKPVLLPGQSLTLLPNGQILMAGGYSAPHLASAKLEIADVSGNARTLPVQMQHARAGHTATVLPDGRVLIFGGYGSDGKVVPSAEMLDCASWSSSLVSDFRLLPRAFHTATVLTDGTLLIIGGAGSVGELTNNVQTWDYRTGTTLAYDPQFLGASSEAYCCLAGERKRSGVRGCRRAGKPS